MRILVLNGVNLNMLGKREPEIYGDKTYNDLENYIMDYANSNSIKVECEQTNHEGVYVEWIQRFDGDAFIVNPGAWTHYSIAIKDALLSRDLPIVEVHLSDINEREEFRKISVIEDIVQHRVMGKGFDGYIEAIDWLVKQ